MLLCAICGSYTQRRCQKLQQLLEAAKLPPAGVDAFVSVTHIHTHTHTHTHNFARLNGLRSFSTRASQCVYVGRSMCMAYVCMPEHGCMCVCVCVCVTQRVKPPADSRSSEGSQCVCVCVCHAARQAPCRQPLIRGLRLVLLRPGGARGAMVLLYQHEGTSTAGKERPGTPIHQARGAAKASAKAEGSP